MFVIVLSVPVNQKEWGFTLIKISVKTKIGYAVRRKEIILSILCWMTDLRVLLTTSWVGFVVGGTMAKLWMATTAELAKSGSLIVVISTPTSASVDWCCLDTSSCISSRVSSGASFVGYVVTGTGLVVDRSDVVLGRRLGKLYFLTRPLELSINATWESSVAETLWFQSHWYLFHILLVVL